MEKMKKQLEAAENDKKKLKENLADRPSSKMTVNIFMNNLLVFYP